MTTHSLATMLLVAVIAVLSPPLADLACRRRAVALCAGTGLPLIVAITAIGVERGTLKSSTAAAMVGAGMLSVLPIRSWR